MTLALLAFLYPEHMAAEQQSAPAGDHGLGLWSGVGLCIASMVGSGIFLSAGYMAQTMSAGAILSAWAVGAVLALVGVATYAELARQLPRYRLSSQERSRAAFVHTE